MRVLNAPGCDTALSLAGQAIPATPVQVIGVLSQYLSGTATTGGYQILPRRPEDLQPAAAGKVPTPAER